MPLRDYNKEPDGELSRLLPKDIVTGNSDEAAGKSVKPATSESEKPQNDSTLPKWLSTNPEILAGQMHDLLALMQKENWFIYLMPVTVITKKGTRTALRITIAPPMPVTIGVLQAPEGKAITINDVPVTEKSANEK